MEQPRHRIRKQSLDVRADSERLALSLQPRLESLNRRRLIPLIERLLDEVSVAGRRLRLDRLEVDLGTLHEGADFEAEVERRLEKELRRALRDEVRKALREPRPESRSLPEEAYRRELLEHYLLRGTVPYWGPPPGEFSLTDLVHDMLESAPRDLARTLRRLSRRRRVLERLVLQLEAPSLKRLIQLLEPEHAALIVAYLTDLRRVHRAERLVRLSESRFERALWLLTQIYLWQDPGSQFNRRSFLRSLLRDLATRHGIDYRQLLLTLERALALTRGRVPIHSSLPAVVAELLAEEGAAEGPPRPEEDHAPQDLDALVAILAEGPVEAPADSPAGEWIRRLADAPRPGPAVVVGRLLDELPSERLLAALAPRHRDWLPELIRRQRRRLPEDTVWQAVLDVLVRRGADRWGAGELLEHLLERLAERTGGEPAKLTEALEGGSPSRRLRRVLEAARQRVEGRPRRPREHGHGEDSRLALGRYSLADRLRHFLHHGMLPWADLLTGSEAAPGRLLGDLSRLPRSLLRAVLATDSPQAEARLRRRLARHVPEDTLGRLLLRLLPATAEPDHPFRLALAEHAERAADRRAFLAAVLLATLDDRTLDLEALLAASVTEGGEAAEDDPAGWPAGALQAALLTRLRFAAPAPTPRDSTGGAAARLLPAAPGAVRDTPLPRLLDLLVESHPQDAQEWLRQLREQRNLWLALLRSLPAARIDALLTWLTPEAAPTLAVFRDSLTSIPSPHRPGTAERVTTVMLGEVVRWGPTGTLTEGFFRRVLQELFGPRVPDPARHHLAREAAAWKRSKKLPPTRREGYGDALEAALDAVAAPEADDAPDARSAAPSGNDAAPRRRARRLAVFAFLLGRPIPSDGPGDSDFTRLSRSSWERLLHQLADEAPAELGHFLRRHLGSRSLRERWSRELSEATLARLSTVLEPRQAPVLLDTAELLASSALEAGVPGARRLAERAALWTFSLDFLHRHAGADRLFERWLHAFFGHAAERLRHRESEDASTAGRALWQAASRLARTTGHARLRSLLQRDQDRLLAPFRPAGQRGESGPPPTASDPEDRKPAFGLEGQGDARDGEPIYIDNAGLVLTGAFLPQLFGSLGFLERDDEGKMDFKDRDSASRAVHLLQYLVDGRTTAPEPLLVLNKLLCGVPLGAPVAKRIEPTEDELETCDKLLRSMLANWDALSGTSVAGLRETFLQREGKLHRGEDGWKLTIQRKTVDILVDRVPWSIAVVLQHWMTEAIYVEW